jgi:hypothetical protein
LGFEKGSKPCREVGIPVGGDRECGVGFAGRAKIDVRTGHLVELELETHAQAGQKWVRGKPAIGKRDLSAGGDGVAHALLLMLEPVIRRRYAGRIGEAISEYYDGLRDAAADDRLRIETEAA